MCYKCCIVHNYNNLPVVVRSISRSTSQDVINNFNILQDEVNCSPEEMEMDIKLDHTMFYAHLPD